MKFLVFLAVTSVGCGPVEPHRNWRPGGESEQPAAVEERVITIQEFKAIKHGMTLDEVTRIVGSEGEEVEVNKGTECVWNNTVDGSFASVLFKNDRVISKTQFELK